MRAPRQAVRRAKPSMTRSLPLAIACGNYDRTRPLFDGRVLIEGCDPTFLPQPPEEIFFRAFVHEEFDVSELSLSSYTMRRSKGDCPYLGIPVFISRTFRHSAVYVRTDRDIDRPEDLRGRLVGIPEYQQTAAVWVRGLLQDDYGVAPRDLRWVSGGMEMPGRVEKVQFTLPAGVSLDVAPDGKTLSGMLEAGELDALIAPRAPSCFTRGVPQVGRLFANFGADEEEYYRRTGIFPIMHIVGIKTALAARHPWLPATIYKAFSAAKDIAVAALSDPNALSVSLPSLTWNAEQAKALMGQDFWSYGLDGNAETLEVFLRYHFEQGLSPRRLTPSELFASSTTSQWKI
jgi:4,5-dihydroxyphthalate decarboxylase